MVRVLGLTICLLCAASPTVGTASDGLEFVPFVGYRLGGSILHELSPAPLELDERENWGFSLMASPDASTRYEFLYSHQGTRLSDMTDPLDAFDLDVHYLHLGGTVDLPHEDLVPFFSGGIDMAHLSPGRAGYSNETRLSLSLGGGLKWTPNDRFGIRFELRGYGTLGDSGEGLLCDSDCEQGLKSYLFPQFETNLGLIYRF
jgi:hypothetical protein